MEGKVSSIFVIGIEEDVISRFIADEISKRNDMSLFQRVNVRHSHLQNLSFIAPPDLDEVSAVVVVGAAEDSNDLGRRILTNYSEMIVVEVELPESVVRVNMRNPGLQELLSSLQSILLEAVKQERPKQPYVRTQLSSGSNSHRAVFDAAIDWVRAILESALDRLEVENGDGYGITTSKEAIARFLLEEPEPNDDLREMFVKLRETLQDNDALPISRLTQHAKMSDFEIQITVLAWIAELDLKSQRCLGFLQDDMGRRAGSISFYSWLFDAGPTKIQEVYKEGNLREWMIFETLTGGLDEPVRFDPYLRGWLLGDNQSLLEDPRVAAVVQNYPWPGSGGLESPTEARLAISLVNRIANANAPTWLILNDSEWRSLLEKGSAERSPIRIETSRLRSLETLDSQQCARRIARIAILTGEPVFIYASEDLDSTLEPIQQFIRELSCQCCNVAMVCNDFASWTKFITNCDLHIKECAPVSKEARFAAFESAALLVGADLDSSQIEELQNRYPLSLEQLEHASQIAASRERTEQEDVDECKFFSACKIVISQGLSRLAERIEPVFRLKDIVLPSDQQLQLVEIVDNMKFASKVLDEWRFGEKLPYGRGVSALFFGPSGTGKTMAAMGIANELHTQLLRLDLSRVVSKYIGETEKNIDRVFRDAERSGAVLLIDEAEAIIGKRSEVKDAHDRYANIEVAYLLQRMENFGGLAILTTNMRQNLDAAFLRRLRFMVDFPKPSADDREKIWRLCLPDGTHSLTDSLFWQLGRKIEVSGGNIRQITLRAAFLAAAAGDSIGFSQIDSAVRAELAKMGLPHVKIDTDRRVA